MSPLKKLSFTIPEDLVPTFSKAHKEFDYHKNIHEFTVLSFKDYGKGLMKTCGFSPDAFVQMAFQLAYYKLRGRAVATYESTQTRAFLYGRTEVTRSCSLESLRWVKAMQEDSRDPDSYKLELLNEAITAHSKSMLEASQGRGVDRHLLGLKMLVKSDVEKMPLLFEDPCFTKSNHWHLSTSQMSSPYYNCWGWGEVVEDGFGLPYSILEDEIYIGISSRIGKTEELKQKLIESLTEMKQLVATNKQIPSKL